MVIFMAVNKCTFQRISHPSSIQLARLVNCYILKDLFKLDVNLLTLDEDVL